MHTMTTINTDTAGSPGSCSRKLKEHKHTDFGNAFAKVLTLRLSAGVNH